MSLTAATEGPTLEECRLERAATDGVRIGV